MNTGKEVRIAEKELLTIDEAAQSMLGHVDVSTTLNIYTDSTKSLMDQAIMEFGKFTNKHIPLCIPNVPKNSVICLKKLRIKMVSAR